MDRFFYVGSFGKDVIAALVRQFKVGIALRIGGNFPDKFSFGIVAANFLERLLRNLGGKHVDRGFVRG
jgi:hypothetical protein